MGLTPRTYHRRWQESCRAQASLQQQMLQASRQIQLQQERQQKVAELDQRLTGELTHEKNHITLLEQRVRAGQRRLQLHARCAGGAEDAAAPGVAHADAARLTDAAQRDYFRLRRRIALIQAQVRGLQDYIRLQSARGPKTLV
jgi:prophage endopeptidase